MLETLSQETVENFNRIAFLIGSDNFLESVDEDLRVISVTKDYKNALTFPNTLNFKNSDRVLSLVDAGYKPVVLKQTTQVVTEMNRDI